ncbi:creatininase family protein, partial [Candidatus Acetothermia bacterium]|nr:creatininase family protein [Candidatus Acetothermia bacterium]
DQSKFEEAARGASPVFGISKFGSQLPVDTLDFSETGATLDPREASPRAGKKLFEASTERLVNLIQWLESVKESELRPKAHKP